ncbi:MAG: diaminopimelate epimerase [Candidatus Nanopelagicales bacterium]|jgi:diaminopimelate epimerase|nr:diaminopimelate epimerase [Candidatus Nanopelagicales bacterium]
MRRAAIPFVKGHGTGNDFVILPNPAGELTVDAALVRALCDRHRGLGADGVLVVARTSDHPEVAGQADVAPWFMDYRNGDGSVAQMCGNGARVFVAHLLEEGLAGSGSFHIATRGGARRVIVDSSDSIRIDMGPATVLDRDDIEVRVTDAGDSAPMPATGVLMPNPHAVTWLDDLGSAGSLAAAPIVTPGEAYPEGVNVEFVRILAAGHLQMRVHERGVGETLSCGTGACAAAVATVRHLGGQPGGGRIRVDVPGGTVGVTWLADGSVELDGPTQVVARGEIDPQWWEMHV